MTRDEDRVGRTVFNNVWFLTFLLLFLTQLCWPGKAAAALPPSTQFDITGFLQEATLNTPTDPHSGGTLKVNGHLVVVPKETIVILPANALTWQELFAQAPAPYTGTMTGLALSDTPTPMSTYEVHVIGNRVIGATTDQYIAGLIYISQQELNSGAGYINFIDYALGEMRVGGKIGDPSTGTRVRINDPAGRFSLSTTTPDKRFTVDPDNPTIVAATGFPMCLPRTDPATQDDPLCPQGNRQKDITGNFLTVLNMPDPATLTAGQLPDPRIQVPLEVGDYITFAGTLVHDGLQPTAGPWPGTAGTYISAHTINDNMAIFTAPGKDPAYVITEVALIGTGGLTVLGAGEAVIRTRFEGMTTDPSRAIHLYGMDLDAAGNVKDRDWGMVGVDQGPPNGAVKGRWRFRPPCTATPSTITDKTCSPPPAGTFLPPTREVRAVIEGKQGTTAPFANGIIAGQYHAPILEYIFPENIPGTPIVENNFNTIDFLAKGGYTSSAGTVVGQLSPWPSNNVPAAPGAPAATCTGIDSAITITAGTTEYRIGKQRLTIQATDTVAGATLTLMPYLTTAGTTFDPTNLGATFTFAGGLYTLQLVGAPEPAVPPATPLVVRSSSGGCTNPFGLDRIRQ